MARRVGARNQDYELKRTRLLEQLTDFALAETSVNPSMRQFAISTSASEPTLRHYFDDRQGVVEAILEYVGTQCEHWRQALETPFPTLEEALLDFARLSVRMAQDELLVQSHLFAMRESLSDPAMFAKYIEHVVDPNIDALARRIQFSKGGPRDFSLARTAAAMMTTNASVVAFRRHMLNGDDAAALDAGERLALHTHWMLHGLLNDPDGKNCSGSQPANDIT